MNLVITISRRFGTGASLIAQELSEKLGVPVYDKAYIEHELDGDSYATEAEVIKGLAEHPCIILGRCFILLVEQVLKDQITDEQQLEQIMDGLCDFCDEIRFIDLYRSLCRHIYYQYPQLVGEHVALFRALFEGPDEK